MTTVIVPDIRLVKEGDLIVKFNIKGEPHIGIVVAKWEGEAPADKSAESTD